MGTLLRNFMRAPAGMMWSVVMRSPTLMVTTPMMLLRHRVLLGGSPMLGPLAISTFLSASLGKMNMVSSMKNFFGMLTFGYLMPFFPVGR